jgi:hypothetical protein
MQSAANAGIPSSRLRERQFIFLRMECAEPLHCSLCSDGLGIWKASGASAPGFCTQLLHFDLCGDDSARRVKRRARLHHHLCSDGGQSFSGRRAIPLTESGPQRGLVRPLVQRAGQDSMYVEKGCFPVVIQGLVSVWIARLVVFPRLVAPLQLRGYHWLQIRNVRKDLPFPPPSVTFGTPHQNQVMSPFYEPFA